MASTHRPSSHLVPLIRSRLSLSDVVRQRVVLTKSGREWKGLSPFQREKTPSFFVNDEKGTWFDFSSGKGGDIFSFLMETEGMSFREALEFLSEKAGISLEDHSHERTVSIKNEASLMKLREVLEMATVFYETHLRESKGSGGLAYLRKRGITEETQTLFRLGYAPSEGDALCRALMRKGIGEAALQAAGLIAKDPHSSRVYDRFRHRLMFPIMDSHGRVIAFGGRALSADTPAKYLNSPETPLFHKSHILYNLHRARAERATTILVVEGYFDVLSLHQADLSHVAAPLGTALTPEHLTQLWRWVPEPILCFDGDGAGQRAAERVMDVALPFLTPGHSLRFAHFPEGQDPDEYVNLVGKEGIENIISQARPLVDVLWDREKKRMPLETPEQKADFENRIRTCIAQISDKRVSSYYKAECESRLSQLRACRQSDKRRVRASRSLVRGPEPLSHALAHSPIFKRSTVQETPRECLILMGFLTHVELILTFGEVLGSLNFSTPEAQSLGAWLLKEASAAEKISLNMLDKAMSCHGVLINRLKSLISLGDRWIMNENAPRERVRSVVEQALMLENRAQRLAIALKEAEQTLAEEWNETNLSIMRDLRTQYESALSGVNTDLE